MKLTMSSLLVGSLEITISVPLKEKQLPPPLPGFRFHLSVIWANFKSELPQLICQGFNLLKTKTYLQWRRMLGSSFHFKCSKNIKTQQCCCLHTTILIVDKLILSYWWNNTHTRLLACEHLSFVVSLVY